VIALPSSEIAREQRASDDLGGPNCSVSDASSWYDDDHASGGDDPTPFHLSSRAPSYDYTIGFVVPG
jgi:hypothetical protein